MDDGIKVQRTTLMVLAGLVLAICLGVFVVFSAGIGKASDLVGGDTQSSGSLSGKTGCGGCGGGALGGSGSAVSDKIAVPNASAPKDIYIHAKSDGGYDISQITVNKGEPVRLHFSADPDAGCGRALVIYGLNVKALSRNGEEDVVDFTPEQAGTYEYNCGMRMWRPGKLVVV